MVVPRESGQPRMMGLWAEAAQKIHDQVGASRCLSAEQWVTAINVPSSNHLAVLPLHFCQYAAGRWLEHVLVVD